MNASFILLKNTGGWGDFFEIKKIKGIEDIEASSNTPTGKLV